MRIGDFIKPAAEHLRVEERAVRSATGSLLGMLERNAAGAEFGGLIGVIPGAREVLQDAREAEGESGGVFGNLMQAANSLLGTRLRGATDVVSKLSRSGLEVSKIGPFVTMFFDFARDQVGDDLVSKLLGTAPELSNLMEATTTE